MTEYPLVVRNNVPLVLRGFMLLFLTITGLITFMVIRDHPEPRLWSPLFMLAFWAAGLLGLIHALNQESSVVRVTNPGSIHIERGKAFRREEHWTNRAQFWIDESKDSDGDPYFKLMMDAPGGRLAIKEGHHRPSLELLQQRIEAALSGR